MPELSVPTTGTDTPTPPAPSAHPTPGAVEWSDEVKRCAAMHGLTDHLPTAIRLAQEIFSEGSEITLLRAPGPDFLEDQVVVHIQTRESVKEASERFQQLLNRWTREMPLHVQSHATVTVCPV